jgi:putative glutamine amidotransferase
MKVMIGVTPDTHAGGKLKTRTKEERIVYLWDSYLKAIMDHGAVPVVLPVTRDMKIVRAMVKQLDGFLLAGGGFDVPPEYYGEKPKPYLGKIKPRRSFLERELLLLAAKRDKPVLGICGGMQIINVAFGGTLFQDILEERPGSRDHQQDAPRKRPVHQVTISPGTKLYRIISGRKSGKPLKIRVNSTHHQAVKDLGEGIIVSAAAADGVIEAIESERHGFMVGVQWHPELLYPMFKEQSRLIRAFVREAKKSD